MRTRLPVKRTGEKIFLLSFLLRKSGTEPLIRIMVEAADAARCEACADDLENVIRERGY